MFLLDDSEDKLVELIESHRLSLAFDISCPGSNRRELRIWTDSLAAMLGDKSQPVVADHATVRQIVHAMVPRDVIKQTELCTVLSCSSSHVSNLLRPHSPNAAPALELFGPRPEHSHASAVTRITRESFVRFLVSRWI